MTQIRPLHDRILVRRIEAESKTKGGLYIPDVAKEKPTQGVVVAVGSGRIFRDGTVRPIEISKGEKILFGKYSDTEIEVEGKKLVLVREDDVLGVVEG